MKHWLHAKTLRRRAAFAAAAGALALTAVVAWRAQARPAADPSPAQTTASAASNATLALSYTPGTGASDLEISRAQNAVRKAPAQAQGYVDLALLFVRRQRESADASLRLYAEDALAAALARAPDSPRALGVRAMLLQDQHRFREAGDLADQLIARVPSDPSGHILKGDALLELGEYAEAERAYQRALDLRPDLRSYERGAHLRWLHGDFEGAVELLELALDARSARDPEASAWCWVALGSMYVQRGDSSRARGAAAQALALVPDYLPALVLEARAFVQTGNRGRALALYRRATERQPSVELLLEQSELETGADSDAHRAEAQRRAEDEPLALSLYLSRHRQRPRRALELSELELGRRKTIAAYDAHALALLRNHRVEEAKRAIDRALRLGTQDATLVLHDALILAALGDGAAARKRLDRALELNRHVDPKLVDELESLLEDR